MSVNGSKITMPYPEWKDSVALGALIIAAAILAVSLAGAAAALR